MVNLHVRDVLLYHDVQPPIRNGGLENQQMKHLHFLSDAAGNALLGVGVSQNHANPSHSPKGLWIEE